MLYTTHKNTLRNNGKRQDEQNTERKHKGAANGGKGGKMTSEQIKELKKAQAEATRGRNFAELRKINAKLYALKEQQQRERAKAREQEREKVLSARFEAFCKKSLSAKNQREL